MRIDEETLAALPSVLVPPRVPILSLSPCPYEITAVPSELIRRLGDGCGGSHG